MHNNGEKIAVLIVAGGSGTRMGADLPKQFLPLAGKPVIVHSVERFIETIPDADIYVAVGSGMEALWNDTARQYGLENRCRLCRGGETRFDTVSNSLEAMEPCDIVLIHDAVRPLVSAQVISNVIAAAAKYGAAIPVIHPVDSFRTMLPDGNTRPFERSVLRAVQTPQGFRYDTLLAAYRQPYSTQFTDDAQVVEAAGHRIALCEGSPQNIKLTYPEDIAVAEGILSARKK